MKTTITIRTLPVATLLAAPYNPRQTLEPTDSAYRKLEASLQTFGLVEPLIWNETTGHVVGGHARLRILQAQGVAEVPVSVVQLNEAQEKALNIVLNNQEAQGRFDTTKLAALLAELQELPELQATGFEPSSLRSLQLEALPELPAPETPLPTSEQVTLTLEMPQAVYDEAAPALDEVIRTYNIVSHLQRT